jgi:peptidoglycan/LPS O-acetylase OafA/YrhL
LRHFTAIQLAERQIQRNAPFRRGHQRRQSKDSWTPMQQRQRKLAGTIALLILIGVYATLALAVAVVLQVQNANKAVELIYYVVAGLLWVLPAAVLIKWMQKPDA